MHLLSLFDWVLTKEHKEYFLKKKYVSAVMENKNKVLGTESYKKFPRQCCTINVVFYTVQHSLVIFFT